MLKPFSSDILQAAYRASNEVTAELAARNTLFRKTYEFVEAVSRREEMWFRTADYRFETFVYGQRGLRGNSRGVAPDPTRGFAPGPHQGLRPWNPLLKK